MANRQTEDEPPRDPGLNQHYSSTAEDFEGHRHHNIYAGLSIPTHRRRSKHHRHRHHHRTHNKDQEDRPGGQGGHHHHHHHRHQNTEMDSIEEDSPDGFILTPPSQRVQFILGVTDEDDDGMHESHPLFCEMETLCDVGDGNLEWKETARWVKFEEDVEEGGERWSKPHVATLSLHSLFELRSFLLNSCVILDMDAFNLVQISDLISDNLINQSQLPYDAREKFCDALLRKHKHLYEKQKGKENGNMSRLPLIRSLAEIGRNHSSNKNAGMTGSQTTGGFFSKAFSFAGPNVNSATDPALDKSPSQGSITNNQSCNTLDIDMKKGNVHFMRKIPQGSEAANILVGEVDFLQKPVTAFVRLTQAVPLGDLTEVPVPTRFLFIILGPQGALSRYHEIGRAIATLLSDEIFHDVAYKAKSRTHLLAGIDEFLDAVTVLPPGEWDPAIRIEPPQEIPSQDSRKNVKQLEVDEEEEETRLREQSGLTRSGRLFGGLINDLKRKAPWYWSDFLDALSMQSLATFFFLYFACLTPIITFGGLLGDATGNNIAAMESLVSGLICGVAYGFFSGQPLTILGSTGPVLVFETIVYDFCSGYGWDYLSFRMWIGLWAAAILILLVAIDASALVCYITRFTEENFATLIAFIFIFKAVQKVLNINDKYPMEQQTIYLREDCYCEVTTNETTYTANYTSAKCHEYHGTPIGDGCGTYYSDIYLLSLLLFIGTFLISMSLKNFKTASFFPAKVRCFISDFAVVIAILLMTLFDFLVGIKTPKLEVPADFKPTLPGRGWLVYPFGLNPWWSPIVAFFPALLACILLFMDQQITAVIVNRTEHKLKKGGGYHLDLFVLALLIVVNSVMGLPWFVAATVLSINHVNALKKESECAAPGEKPQFLGVRENRVTHIMIFAFIGLSVLMTSVLSLIPMAVLYGVFLYMGIAALKGIQFFDRILLMFMPNKYQPDYAFLRQVPLKKVHLFTAIQVACLAVLWVIKSFKQTSILFPLMLVVMVGVRKCLDWVFTQRELSVLDDRLPEFSRKEKLTHDEEEEEDIDEMEAIDAKEGMVSIPLANGNVMRVPVNPINISEEVNKSGIWKDINHGGTDPSNTQKSSNSSCKRCRRRSSRKHSKTNGHANGRVHNHIEEEDDDLGANEINFGSKKSKNDSVFIDTEAQFTKKRGTKKDAINADEQKRLSMMAEEDEDDDTITIKITSPPSSKKPILKKAQSMVSSETSV